MITTIIILMIVIIVKVIVTVLAKMMIMMTMINCFCGMVARQKMLNLISCRDHCQRSSLSQISDTARAGFEPAANLSSALVEWSCAVVITTTPQRHCNNDNCRHKKSRNNKNLRNSKNNSNLNNDNKNKNYNSENNNKNKTSAFIIGDSIEENMNRKYVVKVQPFSQAKVQYMYDHFKPTLRYVN